MGSDLCIGIAVMWLMRAEPQARLRFVSNFDLNQFQVLARDYRHDLR
jgi:hypothetical protein